MYEEVFIFEYGILCIYLSRLLQAMKKFISCFAFYFIFHLVNAQHNAPNKFDENNLRDGKWIFFVDTLEHYVNQFDSSGTYRIAEYNHGKLAGPVYEYNSEDKLILEAEFSSLSPDTLNGNYISYYPSGKKHEQYVYQNGIVEGKTISWFENGNIYVEVPFKNGKHHGQYNEYYENGNIHRKGELINGEKNGLFIFYDEKGIISEERNYVNDELDGEKKVYRDGKLLYMQPFIKGIANGVGQYYKSDGTGGDFFISYEGKELDVKKMIELSGTFLSEGEYEKGILISKIMEEYFRKVYGTENEIYDYAVGTLAKYYYASGDSENGKIWVKKTADIYFKTIGTDNEASADAWHLLSFMCDEYGLNEEKIIADKRTIAKSYKDNEPTPETLDYMLRLGSYYFTKYKIKEGENIYDSLLQIIEQNKKKFGKDYAYYGLQYVSDLTNSRNNLKALSVLKKIEPSATASEKNRIQFERASIFYDENNIDEANTIFNQLYDKFPTEQKDSLLQIQVTEKRAIYAMEIANYSESEKLYLNLLALTEQYEKTKDAYYYSFISDLADFYDRVGRYNKSLPLRENLVTYYKEQIDEPLKMDFLLDTVLLKTLYLNAMLDYAETNLKAGNSETAGEMYSTLVYDSKKLTGDSSILYIKSLAALAGWQMDEYNYEDSENNYKKVIALSETYFNNTDVNYDTWLDNLAELYFRKKDYDDALNLAEQVYESRKKMYQNNDPMLLASYGRLSEIYEAKGNIRIAYSYLRKDMDARASKIQADFSIMNQNEKEQYLSTFRYRFDEFNSFALLHQDSVPEIAGDVLNYDLINKSLLLNSLSEARNTFANNADTSIQNLYKSWLSKKQLYTKLEMLSDEELSQQNYSLSQIKNESETIEKELFIKTGYSPTHQNSITWQLLQQNLKQGEAFIEYLIIPDYTDTSTNNNYCAAILLKKNAEPVFIKLCKESELLSYLEKNKNETDLEYVNRLYSYPEFEEDTSFMEGRNIFNKIWKPVQNNLLNIQKIYLVQSGSLLKLNMSAMPVSPDAYLSDMYSVSMISSAKTLSDNSYQATLSPTDTIVLFGGINYQAPDAQLLAAAKKNSENKITPAYTSSIAIDTALIRGGNWQFLPGTVQEIKTISEIASQKKINYKIFSGEYASEDVFKTMKTPSVLHIATHGFFVQNLPKSVIKNNNTSIDYSLYNSGILLAGGARSWQGEKPQNGLQDGILTAAEVNALDMSNCKLVVLSACETGLGEIKNDEGVFGLQRAFKLAGVENMMMSLWQVSDAETATFMKLFYSNWASGISIEEAFHKTQQTMRIQYSPYYWAAFILIK